MKKLITYQIDAFTQEKFKGNPAGVVVNADGLTSTQMQRIARELNNSETAFLFLPEDDQSDGAIRYFTPSTEVPICGHATIAAMYAWAVEKKLNSCVLKIKTPIGLLPFEIIKTEDSYQVVMTQGAIEIGSAFDQETAKKILEGLGLNSSALDARCPIQIASTGHSKVMIGVESRSVLHGLKPDLGKLALLSQEIGSNGYFVFTLNTNGDHLFSEGRMFAPAIGIDEDPVTGNANGPLGAYLVHNKLVNTSDSIFEFIGGQGFSLDREGAVHVSVEIENNKPKRVRIKGDAVIVFKTAIALN